MELSGDLAEYVKEMKEAFRRKKRTVITLFCESYDDTIDTSSSDDCVKAKIHKTNEYIEKIVNGEASLKEFSEDKREELCTVLRMCNELSGLTRANIDASLFAEEKTVYVNIWAEYYLFDRRSLELLYKLSDFTCEIDMMSIPDEKNGHCTISVMLELENS